MNEQSKPLKKKKRCGAWLRILNPSAVAPRHRPRLSAQLRDAQWLCLLGCMLSIVLSMQYDRLWYVATVGFMALIRLLCTLHNARVLVERSREKAAVLGAKADGYRAGSADGAVGAELHEFMLYTNQKHSSIACAHVQQELLASSTQWLCFRLLYWCMALAPVVIAAIQAFGGGVSCPVAVGGCFAVEIALLVMVIWQWPMPNPDRSFALDAFPFSWMTGTLLCMWYVLGVMLLVV